MNNGNPGANFLFASSEESGNFTIESISMSSLVLPLSPMKSISIRLPDNLESMPKTNLDRVGILVTSTVDMTIYALNENTAGNSEDSYAVLPITALSTIYVVTGAGSNELITVAAVEDSTHVNITLKTTCNVDWERTTYYDGDTISVDINSLGVLQLSHTSNSDRQCVFAGTKVSSDKPVSVLSGASCTGTNCDHAVTQMLPVELWGKRFIVPSFNDTGHIRIQIAASEDDTNIYVTEHYGDGTRHTTHRIIDANRVMDIYVPNLTFTEIFSYKNILVTGFSTGPAPFSFPIASIESFGWNYTISTMDNVYASNFSSFVNILTKTDMLSTLTMDGYAPHPSHWSRVTDLGYSVATIPITRGGHRFEASDPFMVLVYGYSAKGSYGYNAGYGFDNLPSGGLVVTAPTLPPTTMSVTTVSTVTASPNSCIDKPGVDCHLLDDNLHVCKDPKTAQEYCRKYCKICSHCPKPGGCIIG
ncbi:hypothetical protein SNE40_021560 [Patella caerulea]